MKKILGLDLGTNSIGWAFVNEAEDVNEKSSITKLGVRVNPLTVDELSNFEKGKSITTNADRTLKRSMRRNLQRFKLRRENLLEVLKENQIIQNDTILSENGNKTTFETYRLRAKSAVEKISLEDFARVLLMINKKRGYKSSRKLKSSDEGQAISGMEVAKQLYENNQTPGEFVFLLLKNGKKYIPDFYRSDLQVEFDKIWSFQKQFYPEILTDEFYEQLKGKSKTNSSKIFLGKYKIFTADNKGKDKQLQAYRWRIDALKQKLTIEEVAYVLSEINGAIYNSSGYLGAISDRSKELFFNKETVGQYLMKQLDENPNASLKNQVFYRQDYLDEFEVIWETQSKFHSALAPELKKEIRDIVIFYQRPLRSQKGLISFCEFESKQIEIEIDGKKKVKTIGLRVCPKSSPLFQEFKIWQILNNIQVIDKATNTKRFLEQDEKEILFAELSIKDKLPKADALKLLFENPKDLDLNFKQIEGNRTQSNLFEIYQKIIELTGHGEHNFSKMSSNEIMKIVKSVFNALGYNLDILHFNSSFEGKEFEKQPLFLLWHLLYSFEGDESKTGNEKLIRKISELFGFETEFASLIANVTFEPDYGNLSTKAIRKILPHLKEGNEYSVACGYAGYRHSKSSLTTEEIENKVLKGKLEIMPKNSLRNPVVEKILNQMINVVNSAIDEFGKPDEIRIELARELKKSAKEREEMTLAISRTTSEYEEYKKVLKSEFGLSNVSRNDIIRYRLYLELKDNGFKTLYSNTYIPREKLFSKEFDIEHIIPQAKLFDDSFSNKTIECRNVNITKANLTACDYIVGKYTEAEFEDYINRIESLYKAGVISKAKRDKLKMKEADIPSGFINRDLNDTQYIAKKAKEILSDIVKTVVPTTGSITDRLREDWQLIDVMQELNWEKYNNLGLTEIIEDKDGRRIRRIKDWTKRNDHRHHAMDALTIAFTKPAFIQFLNNLNARSNKAGSIYGIEQKELYRDERGKLRFKPPMPLDEFRSEAKRQLENTLVSIKAKNKVTTQNINTTSKKTGNKKKVQLTPRGQLHNETVYGSSKRYVTKEIKVGSNFNLEIIETVSNKKYREALKERLLAFDNDPKKAFAGKNSLNKNPIWLDELHTSKVPEKVKTVSFETIYTIRKEVSKDLKLDKVVDVKVRKILEKRLQEFDGDANKAFSNLDENPIWLNKEKGIDIKRVTITGVSNAVALHDKRDKDGNLIFSEQNTKIPTDFVSTSNNHHVAIYRDENGNLQEDVVSFYEVVERVNQNLPIINKTFNAELGWEFLFTMKQNEYFVFPNETTGFNPNEIDLTDPENYASISPNLYRVQKFGSLLSGFWFRHHLETTVETFKELKGITYKVIQSANNLKGIVKVRINHIGKIVQVGEY